MIKHQGKLGTPKDQVSFSGYISVMAGKRYQDSIARQQEASYLAPSQTPPQASHLLAGSHLIYFAVIKS